MERYFPKGIIPNGWNEVLNHVNTEVVSFDYGMVAVTPIEGLVYINSVSRDNRRFSFGMQRLIIQTIKDNDRVVVTSELEDSCLKRLTDKYTTSNGIGFFTKGV